MTAAAADNSKEKRKSAPDMVSNNFTRKAAARWFKDRRAAALFAENTILYLCDILEHSLNPFRRFSIIFLCQSGLEETGRTAAAGKSPVKRAMNRGLKMIEEIGSVVGGEHYLAAMLILIFSVKLGWLPSQGMGGIQYMIMPGLCIGFGYAAQQTRLMRSGMVDVLREDYITARRAWITEIRKDAEKEYALGDVEEEVLDNFISQLDREVDFENQKLYM